MVASIFGVSSASIDELLADLANTTDITKGDALIGVNQPYVGSVGRTQHSHNADTISAFDFMTQAQIDDVRAGTALVDCTAALQAAISAAQSSVSGSARALYLPGGKYKINSSLVIGAEFITIYGDGPYSSVIYAPGVVGGIITTGVMNYLRPFLRDFALIGDASGGIGLNLGNLQKTSLIGQCYFGEIRNLIIYSGGTAFSAPGATSFPQFFSMVVQNVGCYSYNGHAFHVWSGPGNTFKSLYAISVPAGKAGYRMAGTFVLDTCNGLNEGDFWGVFGSKTTGTDGFQTDFGATDYPEFTLLGCNIERFGSRTAGVGIGIKIVQAFRTANIIGGTIQRADADIPSTYAALVWASDPGNGTGNFINLGWGAIYLRDTINGSGPNTPTLGHFVAENTAAFQDTNQITPTVSIVSWWSISGNITYGMLRTRAQFDVYGGVTEYHTALSAYRFSSEVTMYKSVVKTPAGVNDILTVTGASKFRVAPVAACSIYKAQFDATPGLYLDYGRNGNLILEAQNGNLTINHNASGADTFFLAGEANHAMAAGEVIEFLRSELTGQWFQVSSQGSSAPISGTYTPTLTNASGWVSGPTVSAVWRYVRTGNFVEIFGNIDGTGSSSTDCSVDVSLPFVPTILSGGGIGRCSDVAGVRHLQVLAYSGPYRFIVNQVSGSGSTTTNWYVEGNYAIA